ncbi:hypothetical protein LEP1GSC060_3734 [Leptospira weilii serovar Ranarum str. ICFT]|uniref:Methylenetetrahydrofolate reductase (NAD(P)H) n=1 Tax=Leptospira weilii serovar Ranarum str. ICFT TaxID=1218598 RepID=N1WB01_9LEPT|nr:hypothetical protein [Leptospira weilii]EMY76115.1 hypothetical protein LEP1GSC060_3734 [Leptospira weilii serovar Ranarum str. ICFT]
MLIDKITNKTDGIVLYGLTPPRKSTPLEKLEEISHAHINRINPLNVDGLILYDIQDETARISDERPFPYMEMLDPYEFAEIYLNKLEVPKIVYKAVWKYNESNFMEFLKNINPDKYLSVFVGASSKSQQLTLTLKEAYNLKNKVNEKILSGGVVIPERHTIKKDEHLRVFDKISNGCSFFISQGVYNTIASKDFLSDYYYYGLENNIPLVPIIFTLTPCGSLKTLQFLKWLGISFPKYLENDLVNSKDILSKSVDLLKNIWLELQSYASEKGIPIGCNIESVSIRKEEINASIELLQLIKLEFPRKNGQDYAVICCLNSTGLRYPKAECLLLLL